MLSTFPAPIPAPIKEALIEVNNHLLTALNNLETDQQTTKEQIIAALKKLPIANYSEIIKYC